MSALAEPIRSPYSRIDEVRRRLESFATLCEKALIVADQGQVEELFELGFAARQMRHSISTSHDMSPTHEPEAADIDGVADSLEATHRAQKGDELLHQLHERELPADVALLADPIGIVALVESLLPTTWNFHEDLVILFGNGLDAPANVLGRIGQERVCVFLPEGPEPEFYPESVHIIRSESELYSLMASWAPRHPKRIVSRSLAECGVSEKEQRALIDAAELYLGYVKVDRNTTSTFADIWLRQGIANLAHTINTPTVATFTDDFIGKPMVVVAPGPSLSKNIKALHKIKGKAIICTFSHTLSAFAAEGVDPDFVITVDSNSLQYHFKSFPMENVEAMVSGATVHSDLLKMPAKRHISMGANGGFDLWLSELFGEDLLVPAGGSVATSAMALGVKWKCDPIIFMGLDLSFPGGQYYVSTSCDGDLKVSTNDEGKLVMDGWSQDCVDMRKRGGPIAADVQKSFTLPGYYGGEVPTTQMFWLFHDWFEKKAAEVGDTVQLINCTEGGSYIEGMQHIPLQGAYEAHIENAPDLSVGEILDARIGKIGPERRENAVAGIESIVKSVERCLSLVGRCDQMAKRVAENPENLEKLEALEADLVSALRATRFMGGSKQRAISMAYERANAAEELSELLAASQDLYQEIRSAAKQVLPGLRDVVREIRCQI
ncbi:MAG: motility associated factor glycosyltransferase family protein [Myxococcales bacterium]|nr:motility associated factor glycosyltransferase family protein [Myxococcales bacterium]